MEAIRAFFRFVVKASLNAVGGGVAGDFVVEVLPAIGKGLRQWWGQRSSAELQRLAEAVAKIPPDRAAQLAEEALADVLKETGAANVPVPQRQAITSFLAHIPSAFGRSLSHTATLTARGASRVAL